MQAIRERLSRWVPLLALGALLCVGGCEGSETREKVDDTVEELAGKKKLDQMESMKQSLSDSREKQEARQRRVDEGASD